MILSIITMMDKSEIIREAQRYLSKGQIDRAITEWEKLVKDNPDGNAYNTIGDLYLRKGDKKFSVEFFHKSAEFFRGEGFSLKALALYKKILNIDILNVDALIALGELSEEKGLITDAMKYYLSAADILSKDENKERFVNIYEKILSLAPFNIPLREKVAGLFLKEGLILNALREYLYIAKLYEAREDYDQTRGYFNKVIDIQPDSKDALLGLSNVYEKTGDIQQAVDCIKRAISASPEDTDLLLRCASLLKSVEAYDEAVSYISKAVQLKPLDTALHRMLGDICLIRDDKEGAWESYRMVLDSVILENNTEEAISIAQRFKDVSPLETGRILIDLYRKKNDTDAVFKETLFIADQLSERGARDRAMEYYREALKIRPDDLNLKKFLAEQELKAGIEPSAEEKERTTEDLLMDADIFIKYGLYDEARPILEELKINEPANIDVHTRLKSVYIETGDKEQAVTECIILSEIYGKRGDVAKKKAYLNEAVGISPDDPRVLERLSAEEAAVPPERVKPVSPKLDDYMEDITEAEFYLGQGLHEDALIIYRRLLKVFPDNEDFKGKVSSIHLSLFGPAVGKEEVVADTGKEARVEEVMPTETVDLQEIVEPQFDSDVLDIFHEFKKGIEKELDAGDFETHYNLGIAYKEMGLIDDAIKEFQTSRNNPDYYIRSTSMLGLCYMEKGLFALAIDAFKSSLNKIAVRDESYWGVMYDLASAYDKNGDIKEAFDMFSKIYGWNSNFRHITEKLNKLNNMLSAKTDTKQKEKKDRVSYL